MRSRKCVESHNFRPFSDSENQMLDIFTQLFCKTHKQYIKTHKIELSLNQISHKAVVYGGFEFRLYPIS